MPDWKQTKLTAKGFIDAVTAEEILNIENCFNKVEPNRQLTHSHTTRSFS